MSDPSKPPSKPTGERQRPSIRLNLSAAAAAAAAASGTPSSQSGQRSVTGTSSPKNAAPGGTSRSSPTPPSAGRSLSPTLAPAEKKQKMMLHTPATVPPHVASASHLTLLHQVSKLHVVFQPPPQPVESGTDTRSLPAQQHWFVQGWTQLYIIMPALNPQAIATSTSRQLALHLRSSSQVTSAQIEILDNTGTGLKKLPTSYRHADPLEHILIKPATSYAIPVDGDASTNGDESSYRFNADSQCSRGAAGITTALRAASIASNLGEIRLSYELSKDKVGASRSDLNEEDKKKLYENWKEVLLDTSTRRTMSSGPEDEGNVLREAQQELYERSASVRDRRINTVAKRLAEVGQDAIRVTIGFKIPIKSLQAHMAGLHVHCSTDGSVHRVVTPALSSPHMYTTAGVFGDHEGTRSWLPCLDSAACRHRSSHEWSIQLTAPYVYGLSVVGAGEDFGKSLTVLHDRIGSDGIQTADAVRELGQDHVNLLRLVNATQASSAKNTEHHVIPPDEGVSSITTLNTIQATVVWCSSIWKPVPARSLGFAVGPFKLLEDPEYFGPNAVQEGEGDDDDEDDDEEDGEGEQAKSLEERHEAFVEAARKNGEGIRQVYFAPVFERKYIHKLADRRLMPRTTIQLLPLSAGQLQRLQDINDAVAYSTVGVPHRALSLMRDILAFPNFRTSSYTQIWIPNAVHGGVTSGALHLCPEVMVNAFLGGGIMDSKLFPPPGSRIPFYQGGRVLQFLQARTVMRGGITAALPLGGLDDVANGYIHSLIECFFMSMYERGHGAHGEGGARGGIFYTGRYAAGSGLNSANLDFLPVQNIEDMDAVIGGVGAVPIEDRQNEHLWRSGNNGSESHTSAMDEYNIRQLFLRDAVEALERGTDRDKDVPLPSFGWFGSHLSLTFLSSNATSSSDLGCGAMELLHPIGGLVYRALKADALRGVIEGRAGVANFLRLIRAAFVAAHLDDIGEKELKLPVRREKKSGKDVTREMSKTSDRSDHLPKPPFVICVNEILKKKGLTHTLFTRALQNLSGPLREPHLLGTLVDVERNAVDPRSRRPFVDPEGFPNSYVRGSSSLYCRVGVLVEVARDATSSQSQSVAKGIQMQAYAEPVIPEGGIAYGGPITMRVVENEGQFREFVKDLNADGSRRDWGTTFLLAKPVTTTKAQTAAGGTIEGGGKDSGKLAGNGTPTLEGREATRAFSETNFHRGGYQAIELIRLTNLTPLLWVRVDPMGLYNGKISVSQPDACLAECLYHDGDAAAQVDAIRALAERPLRIQSSTKVTAVYDVPVSELPVRVIGDCLRGSPALHSSLPHTPVVRSQAALAIAQWQNNKAPKSKDAVGLEHWVGATLLIQYFRERFYSNGVVMPVKFSRLVLKKNAAEVAQTAAASEGAAIKPQKGDDYLYLDSLEAGEERAEAVEDAEKIEMEEDEEYRVRSAVVTALACVRAKDGQTPSFVIRFLETILEAEDAEMVGNLVFPDEELISEKNSRKEDDNDNETDEDIGPSLAFIPSLGMADALLSLCFVNVAPAIILDPATGKRIQSSGAHPASRLLRYARLWLDWELYREKIRLEIPPDSFTGISNNCHNLIAPAAIAALSNLAIMRQCTTDPTTNRDANSTGSDEDSNKRLEESTVKFYVDIFDSRPIRNDLTRAACAQAMASICCAADRLEDGTSSNTGLLTALTFLLDRINEGETSPSLRQTLSLIMMDACTGKVCSLHRIGSIAGRNDLITSITRYLLGPLGASHGGDNGSAIFTAVAPGTLPAANAVNDGARRGLRLLKTAGSPRETGIKVETIARVARFATKLWRTINGEPAEVKPSFTPNKLSRPRRLTGVCAFDGSLRCSLLSLWQWIWPKGCPAVLAVQEWSSRESTQRYRDIGAHLVMKFTDEERAAAMVEENALADINRLVNVEIDRQKWRGEMSQKAYEIFKATKGSKTPMQDVAAAEQGIGLPLPPIERDGAFRCGGWIASAAQQRRAKALDGGTAVTKLRLKVKNSSDA